MVAAVTAKPATIVDWCRTDVTSSGTKVSVPKNANVNRPRTATTAGNPAARTSVPGGSSPRSGDKPTSTPAATSGNASRFPVVSPASTNAAPAATRVAGSSVVEPRAVPGNSSGGSLASARVGMIAAITTNGRSPANTQRQPRDCATS